MENQNQELSHDDIWDDSMLVDSWNEALAEYKVISKAQMFRSDNKPERIRS